MTIGWLTINPPLPFPRFTTFTILVTVFPFSSVIVIVTDPVWLPAVTIQSVPSATTVAMFVFDDTQVTFPVAFVVVIVKLEFITKLTIGWLTINPPLPFPGFTTVTTAVDSLPVESITVILTVPVFPEAVTIQLEPLATTVAILGSEETQVTLPEALEFIAILVFMFIVLTTGVKISGVLLFETINIAESDCPRLSVAVIVTVPSVTPLTSPV